MDEDEAKHRAERAEYHVAAQRRRSEAESAKARVLVDRFVAEATERGILTQELTARPWSGRGPLPDRGRRLVPAIRIVRSGSRPGRARRRRGHGVGYSRR